MSSTEHWTHVWAERDPEQVTWFQARPSRSLELVTAVAGPGDPIVDVGGGASRLVDLLLERGFGDVLVVDLADGALAAARARLGADADRASWRVADARTLRLDRPVAVWHDRAVFHFLVDPADRAAYIASARSALLLGGHAVIATFGPDGPDTCSGLPTCRYDATGLAAEFGEHFELVTSTEELHVAPNGASQQFVYVVLRRVG